MNKLVLLSLFALILVINQFEQSEGWNLPDAGDAPNRQANDVRNLRKKIMDYKKKDESVAKGDDIEEIDDEMEEGGEDIEEKPSYDEWKYAVKSIVEEVGKLLE